MYFSRNGSWDESKAILIVGDLTQGVFSIRRDITYDVLTEASIYDFTEETPALIYALAQQNMVALRVSMRMGWELPNPVTPLNPAAATRVPFAVLAPNPIPTP
jgi:hypothetical protein